MEIRKIDNTSFGAYTKTPELIESVLLKNFKSEGINSIKTVMQDIFPEQKAIGARGYKYYSTQVKKLVAEQYPELYKDIETISKHIKQNPNISKPDLAELVEPIIKKHGENIDINV